MNPAAGAVVAILSVAGLIALDLRYWWVEPCVPSAPTRSDTITVGLGKSPALPPSGRRPYDARLGYEQPDALVNRIEQLHFAQATPFETLLTRQPAAGQRVLSPLIAKLVRQEMIGMVENGTGQRLRDGIRLPGGRVLPIGGKTGTGDNRFHESEISGKPLGSRVVNRTAAFVFFIGDRFYGTVLAFVADRSAAHYQFTSALAVQILKDLEPRLLPLVAAPPRPLSGPEQNFVSYNTFTTALLTCQDLHAAVAGAVVRALHGEGQHSPVPRHLHGAVLGHLSLNLARALDLVRVNAFQRDGIQAGSGNRVILPIESGSVINVVGVA